MADPLLVKPTEHPREVRPTEPPREVRQLETISKWMDRYYIDPLLGFIIPGGGDTLGALIGLYGVLVAARLKAHPVIIARMLLNLGIDALLGTIPLLGVILDFFYRAHTRNLELLKTRKQYKAPQPSDWLLVVGAVALLFLLAVVIPALVVVFVANALTAVWS